jgi:hypothetical protein
LIYLNYVWWGVQVIKLFIMQLSTISCYFTLAPNTFSVHCLRIFPLYVIPLISKNSPLIITHQRMYCYIL